MGKKKENILNIFAFAAHGKGISGGDRIFIEISRNLYKKIKTDIFVTEEGYEMCKRQDLHKTSVGFHISNIRSQIGLRFITYYIKVILEGIKLGFSLQYSIYDIQHTYLYSASDFWMDVFPCLILKMRFPKIKWVATWFQTAPNPLIGFSEVKRQETYKISALLYWFSQLPVKPLINCFANYVVVNNEDERKRFPKFDKTGNIFVMIGAVRLDEIKKYQSLITNHRLPKYEAVFQGRFHPQKGVVELIEIWRKVVNKIPNAKLAIIGDGPLMEKVKLRIKNYKLQKNVKLFGYVFDGNEKYKIFSQSKIVVHPAFYDSGGMASAEAMAFKLPCVGFDLISYKSYYPKGMLKVDKGNLKAFSDKVVELIKNSNLRNHIGKDAYDMINKNWSWEKRANEFLSFIVKDN